jgi:hypothetical protein
LKIIKLGGSLVSQEKNVFFYAEFDASQTKILTGILEKFIINYKFKSQSPSIKKTMLLRMIMATVST